MPAATPPQHGPPDHPVTLFLARLGKGSRRAVQHALRVLAELLEAPGVDPFRADWAGLDEARCLELRRKLLARFAGSTARRVLLVLRGVLREAARAGQVDSAVSRSVRGVSARGRPSRAVRAADLEQLFAHCEADDSAAGARDAAALALLYGAGLQRADAVALDRADYHRSGRLAVSAAGKRGPRRVQLDAGARAALDAWLAHRGSRPGPLLCPVDKSGRVTVRRITDQALYMIVVRRSQRAGVRVSPNDLRRPHAALRARAVRRGRGDAVPGLPVPFAGGGRRHGGAS